MLRIFRVWPSPPPPQGAARLVCEPSAMTGTWTLGMLWQSLFWTVPQLEGCRTAGALPRHPVRACSRSWSLGTPHSVFSVFIGRVKSASLQTQVSQQVSLILLRSGSRTKQSLLPPGLSSPFCLALASSSANCLGRVSTDSWALWWQFRTCALLWGSHSGMGELEIRLHSEKSLTIYFDKTVLGSMQCFSYC